MSLIISLIISLIFPIINTLNHNIEMKLAIICISNKFIESNE